MTNLKYLKHSSMSILTFLKESKMFFFLTAGVYTCYLIVSLFSERMFKQPFKNSLTGEMEYFKGFMIMTFAPPLVGCLIGKSILLYEGSTKKLPWRDCGMCGLITNVTNNTYNIAIIESSFPAVVMVKSCSLLSVILVAVFCSKVKEKTLKLGPEKIVIGGAACLGIILFNFFKKVEDSQNKPLTIFSLGFLCLMISLIGDGFMPDYQAKIKSEHKPTSIEMFYAVNLYTAAISLIVMVVTGHIFWIFSWLYYHEGAMLNLLFICLLNSFGQLFVYRMLKQFRQHVPSFVIALRKCLTVIVNILWFHHSIQAMQVVGLLIVFGAVFMEVWSNYKNKQKQQLKVIESEEEKLSYGQASETSSSCLDQHPTQQIIQPKTNKINSQTEERNSTSSSEQQ